MVNEPPSEHSKGLPPTQPHLSFSLNFPFSFCNFPPARQNTFLQIDLIQKIRVKICSVSTTRTPPDLIKFLEQSSFLFHIDPRPKQFAFLFENTWFHFWFMEVALWEPWSILGSTCCGNWNDFEILRSHTICP